MPGAVTEDQIGMVIDGAGDAGPRDRTARGLFNAEGIRFNHASGVLPEKALDERGFSTVHQAAYGYCGF